MSSLIDRFRTISTELKDVLWLGADIVLDGLGHYRVTVSPRGDVLAGRRILGPDQAVTALVHEACGKRVSIEMSAQPGDMKVIACSSCRLRASVPVGTYTFRELQTFFKPFN